VVVLSITETAVLEFGEEGEAWERPATRRNMSE
jgi:hypothetical protein